MTDLSIGELISKKQAHVQTGPFGTQLKASEYVDEGIPVLNVRNIGFGNLREDKLEYITEKKAQQLKGHFLKEGDIVFGRKGAVERHLFVQKEQEGWIQGSDCLRLRILTSDVSPLFLSYYFRTKGHQDWMNNLCSFGATMTSLNQEIISRIRVPLPDIQNQLVIAKFLDAFNKQIEINDSIVKEIEASASQLFKEWFVRMRFPGYKKVHFEKGIPEGWQHKPIGKVIDYNIGGGWGNDKQNNEFSVSGYVIRGTDIPRIRRGEINKDVYRYHKASNMKSRELRECDIIFETAGGSEGQLLGRTCFITQETLDAYGDKVMAASFCKQIRTTSIPSLYLYYFLNYLYETGMIETFQVQSTGISNYQFEPFLKFQEILLPKYELMRAFHDQVMPIHKQIAILGQQNSHLRQIRDRFLPRLISRKLQLKEQTKTLKELA